MPNIPRSLKEFYPEWKKEEKLLLSDFPPETKENWLKEINKILEKSGKSQGIDGISWKISDGFVIPPFFMQEDVKQLEFIYDYPGVYPYTRSKKFSQSWEILQYIQGDKKEWKIKLEQNIKRGAEGIVVPIGDRTFPYIFYGSPLDINSIWNDFHTYSFRFHLLGTTKALWEYLKKKPDHKGAVLLDPFLELVLEGESPFELLNFFDFIKKNHKEYSFPFLAVRSDLFHHTGISISMELGLLLSIFVEILNFLQDTVPLDEILPKITLVQSIGSLYFLEIARLRATRRLIAMVLKAFGMEDYPEGPKQMGVSSIWNHSIYDIYNNMLRNTVSTMAGILGGVDSFLVLPITAVHHTDDEFSRRMAINTQLILKYESHFDYVVDPAGGSYYIEYVTDMLIKTAWNFFLEIEDQGGFLEAFRKNWISDAIRNQQEERIQNIQKRKEFLLGVNQFPNPEDLIIKDYPQLNILGKFLSDPNNPKAIRIFRAPSLFEELRLKTEKLSRTKGVPVIQLIPFGKLSMQRARASFMINFFGCGGFLVQDPGNLQNKENILNFLKHLDIKKIRAFALCSSDEEYYPMWKELKEILISMHIPVLIAGFPDSHKELQKEGIFDFIHIKSNIYETLKKYQNLFFNI